MFSDTPKVDVESLVTCAAVRPRLPPSTAMVMGGAGIRQDSPQLAQRNVAYQANHKKAEGPLRLH